jgi:signal peptidase I
VNSAESSAAAEPTPNPDWRLRLRQALQSLVGWIQETALVVLLALALSVFLRTFVFQAFYVPSESMVNTFLTNDRIIASKLSYRFGEINRGDIVVFRDPGNWLNSRIERTGIAGTIDSVLTFVGVLPSNTGEDLVKRVIGLPGDKVECCGPNGRIVVNGVEIDETAYVRGGTNTIDFSVVVPDGHIFVMGDNREYSADSRVHLDENDGAVPIDNVVGQVVSLIWPLDRFGFMTGNEPFSKVPAAK